jgi:hypothetical protein
MSAVLTRLTWHSKLSKKRRAACVTAAQRSGYPEASDDGAALCIPGQKGDAGPVWIFLMGSIRGCKLFSGIK